MEFANDGRCIDSFGRSKIGDRVAVLLKPMTSQNLAAARTARSLTQAKRQPRYSVFGSASFTASRQTRKYCSAIRV